MADIIKTEIEIYDITVIFQLKCLNGQNSYVIRENMLFSTHFSNITVIFQFKCLNE